MTEQECLARMVAPGQRRPRKYREGVIQIHVTRACDKACNNCTQGSNYRGKVTFMSPDHFRQACRSLKGYFGVVGMFGGNPALHPQFEELCAVMREEVPADQRGLWCNNPITVEKARVMRVTFDPAISNLNVHLDQEAYDKFKDGWPECSLVGLTQDSRHAPAGFVAMRDVLRVTCNGCSGNQGYYDRANGERYLSDPEDGTEWQRCEDCEGSGFEYDESKAWELISACDINQHWSAMIGVFRGELRAWFCEIAGAQAMLHQDEPDYPDTGLIPTAMYSLDVADPSDRYLRWWQLKISEFAHQVRKHCHECSVPLRGWGELAMDQAGIEQTSATHEAVAKPKRSGKHVRVVTRLEQLGTGRMRDFTRYLQNAEGK